MQVVALGILGNMIYNIVMMYWRDGVGLLTRCALQSQMSNNERGRHFYMYTSMQHMMCITMCVAISIYTNIKIYIYIQILRYIGRESRAWCCTLKIGKCCSHIKDPMCELHKCVEKLLLMHHKPMSECPWSTGE